MTIYTAIFGPYEELKRPLVITPGWEYICYTDQPFKSDVWEVRQAQAGDPQRTARGYKILNPDNYEMWVDGSFVINCDLNEFWAKYYTEPFSVPSHPIRDCVFEEAATCIKNKRGNDRDIKDQWQAYKRVGMPRNNGLVGTGVLLRDGSQRVREWCEFWHKEVCLRSTRDQLAFAHVSWLIGTIHHTFKWDYRTSQDLIFQTHYHRRKDGIILK